jgi:uncharacterized protein
MMTHRWIQPGARLAAAALILATTVLLGAPVAQAQAPCGTDYTVRPGDTLSAIAARTLNDLTAWPRIVAATNARATVDARYSAISNPNTLMVGMTLCVPGSGNATAVPVAPAAATPVPTRPPATPTPAATPIPIDVEELTIEWLRAQEIPGSLITVEEVLAPGSNYNRYLVSYLSDGLKIYAYMTIPQGTRPATGWPAIIFNHGYIPPEVYRSTERYIAYTDGFARNGYIVFRPDYRGHGFSEGNARGAYSTPDYVIDVLNALESVSNHPEVDPDRIGMWGHSMGGYITMRAMVVRDDIKAGVIWAGVVGSYVDMLENWRRNPATIPASIPTNRRRWREQLVEEFGTPEQNPQAWDSISANAFLDDLSGPVQLHHGTADTSVPHTLSVLTDAQVRAAGQVSEYFEYRGDDHNLSASFYTAMQRSVAFFDRYVKNAN